MSDTSPEIEAMVAERYRQMTPEERVRIAASMFETARVIVESSLPATLTRRERQLAFAQRFAEPPLPLHGDADRYNHRDGNDDYTQAGNLFRLFDAGQSSAYSTTSQRRCRKSRNRSCGVRWRCLPNAILSTLKLDPLGDDRIKGTSATDRPLETLAT